MSHRRVQPRIATVQRLLLQQQRRRQIERAFLGIWALLVLFCTTWGFRGFHPSTDFTVRIGVSLVVGSLIGGLVLHFLRPALNRLHDRFAASWVIEIGDDDVVRVFGSVPLPQWDRVRAQMLEAKPNTLIVPNAPAAYGCVMAAVPASLSYLSGQPSGHTMALRT